MLRLILTAIFSLIAVTARAEDQGFFGCLNLSVEQKVWFSQPGISECCRMADGMPTRYEERPDGIYVPNINDERWVPYCADKVALGQAPDDGDHSWWFKVIDGVVLKKGNPIGVAVIWWTNASWINRQTTHTVRCFIGLPRV